MEKGNRIVVYQGEIGSSQLNFYSPHSEINKISNQPFISQATKLSDQLSTHLSNQFSHQSLIKPCDQPSKQLYTHESIPPINQSIRPSEGSLHQLYNHTPTEKCSAHACIPKSIQSSNNQTCNQHFYQSSNQKCCTTSVPQSTNPRRSQLPNLLSNSPLNRPSNQLLNQELSKVTDQSKNKLSKHIPVQSLNPLRNELYAGSVSQSSFPLLHDSLTFQGINLSETLPKKSSKKNSCNQCEYATEKKSNLVRHVKSQHLKIENHCDICGFSTPHQSYLKRHMKLHISDKVKSDVVRVTRPRSSFLKFCKEKREEIKRNISKDLAIVNSRKNILFEENITI